MTEPSKAAMEKAHKLVIKGNGGPVFAVARNIQQVSDAAKLTAETGDPAYVRPFILPEPVDPLVEAVRGSVADPKVFASAIRQRLAEHGLKIVKDET